MSEPTLKARFAEKVAEQNEGREGITAHFLTVMAKEVNKTCGDDLSEATPEKLDEIENEIAQHPASAGSIRNISTARAELNTILDGLINS